MARNNLTIAASATALLFGIGLLLAAGPARSQEAYCVTDSATGLPLPAHGAGLCVSVEESSVRLIQANRDGLLILLSDTPRDGLAGESPGGMSTLRLAIRDALLVYCTAAMLDPSSYAPTAECLADFPTLMPGPGAFVGSGTVQANVVMNAAGAASCPSSVHVLAEVRSPAGDALALRSSMMLTASPAGPRSGSVEGCRLSFSTADLSYLRAASEPRGVGDLERPSLDELDGRQLRILSQLIQLDDATLDSLELELAGAVGGPPANLWDLDSIGERVQRIKRDTNIVKGRIPGNLSARLPDREDLRDLHKRVNVADLIGLADQITPEIRGILEVAQELRSDFEDWGPCDGGDTLCDEFRDELEALIDDAEEVQKFVQSVSCLDAPFREERGLETDLLRRLLAKTPDIALFAVQNILDEVAPDKSAAGQRSGIASWRTTFRDVLDGLEAEDLVSKIESACDEASAKIGGDPLRCIILRPPEVREVIEKTHPVGKTADTLFQTIDKINTKYDVEVTIEGVVGGGAGFGKNFVRAVKALTQLLASASEKLGSDKAKSVFDDLQDKRDKCLDQDADMISDLADCTARPSYFLGPTLPPRPRPDFKQLVDLVDREIRQVERCQGRGGCEHAEPAEAQDFRDRAIRNLDTLKGFRLLCDAHCELIDDEPCRNTAGGGRGT